MKLNPRTATAVAIAMALGTGAAQAATVSFFNGTVNPGNPGVYYSQQGQVLSGVATAQALPSIVVTLGADYSPNDNITLRIAGTTGPTVGGNTNANLTQVPTTVNANAATDNGITCADAGTALPQAALDATPPIIVSFITRNGNDILLRVTQKNIANTVGVICQVTGIEVTRPSLQTLGTITGSWAATTAITNISFDPGSALTLANVIDQFTSTTTTALNGIVDVNVGSLRTKFFTDDGAVFAGNEDSLVWTATNQNGVLTVAAPVATLGSVVTTLNGNFSYLDTNSDNDCSNDAIGADLAIAPAGPTLAVAANCLSITVTDAAPAAGARTYTLTFGPNGSKVINAPQAFTATQKFNITAPAASSETDNLSPGAWTLNGMTAWIDYMPFGSNATPKVSQIIYIANRGAQTGAITVDARNEAGTACSFSGGTVGATRVQALSGTILAGIETCYGVGFNGKVHLTITANIPQVDGEVYSAYNVGGSDRGTVVNTTNGRCLAGPGINAGQC